MPQDLGGGGGTEKGWVVKIATPQPATRMQKYPYPKQAPAFCARSARALPSPWLGACSPTAPVPSQKGEGKTGSEPHPQ